MRNVSSARKFWYKLPIDIRIALQRQFAKKMLNVLPKIKNLKRNHKKVIVLLFVLACSPNSKRPYVLCAHIVQKSLKYFRNSESWNERAFVVVPMALLGLEMAYGSTRALKVFDNLAGWDMLKYAKYARNEVPTFRDQSIPVLDWHLNLYASSAQKIALASFVASSTSALAGQTPVRTLPQTIFGMGVYIFVGLHQAAHFFEMYHQMYQAPPQVPFLMFACGLSGFVGSLFYPEHLLEKYNNWAMTALTECFFDLDKFPTQTVTVLCVIEEFLNEQTPAQ